MAAFTGRMLLGRRTCISLSHGCFLPRHLVRSCSTTPAPVKKDAPAPPVKEPWHVFTPNALAVLNTVGNLCALSAAATHDHMLVRALSGSAALCVASFNFLMPKPLKAHQKTAGSWGLVFSTLHLANLAWLMYEQDHGVKLTDEEEDIYENGFQRHGVTPRQFQKLKSAGAKFVDYEPGQTIVELGAPVNKVFYVTHGHCHAEKKKGVIAIEIHQDVFIGVLRPGVYRAEYEGREYEAPKKPKEDDSWEDAWLIEHAGQHTGKSARRLRDKAPELRDMLEQGLKEKVGASTPLRAGEAWNSHIVAGPYGCRILEWPLGAFTCAVGSDEKLCNAMAHIDAMGLASKISSGASRLALEGYNDILRAAVADGRIEPEEKHALHRFRARHAVPDSEHVRMLQELGWTTEEFEDGIQDSAWEALGREQKQSWTRRLLSFCRLV
eukprot:TRINITY_DN94448_c0_g1_i1.p1 TRINITY_DN94448_c0_g1~~TRINITY_DN94448_c0_g1_i1.p1  ORF type:complete len:438 (+),score=75.96 TRINITY_DN94448_c0_g1_i1:63-1376(+)